MKNLTLKEIANACGGTISDKYENLVINSITTDSRKACKDCLFVPLKGERVDGHKFISQVFESGATATLSEQNIEIDKPVILVKSCYQAVKDIAEYYRSLFEIPFIGISGSVGKTSTKEMIASVLSQGFETHKTQGNFNNELGVPLTIFGVEEKHQVAVIEMGISDFGEMTRLSKIVKPNICVITNIGDCHLENLIDRNGVLKAKTEMFINRDKEGAIFLNGDDKHLSTVDNVDGTKPIFYGIDSKNSYYAENIENNGSGKIKATLCTPQNRIDVEITAIGTYMVANALVAVAIGEYLGMSAEDIARGVESYRTVGSRDGVIKTECMTIIDDCYNANPVSVKGGVDTLKNFNTRKVCVLGDMKELGANSKQLHIDTGKYVAEKEIDVLVAVGEEAKYISEGACGKNTKIYHFDTVQQAIDNISDIIIKGDTVLVKASHSMKFENIVSYLKDLTL